MMSSDSNPPMTVTIAMTMARRGRSTKMADNMGLARIGWCGDGAPEVTGMSGRTNCNPSTITISPPLTGLRS
jgi:hypothetical protein